MLFLNNSWSGRKDPKGGFPQTRFGGLTGLEENREQFRPLVT